MIYQKFKEFAQSNLPLTDELIKKEIDQVLVSEQNSFPQILEDLIFSHLELKGNDNLKQSIEAGFHYLFSKGLNWTILQDIKISQKPRSSEKKKLIELNLFHIKDILKKPIEDYFMYEFEQNPFSLIPMAFKIFSTSLFNDDQLKIISDKLDIKNNKEILEKLMLATKNFNQMNQVSNVLMLDPWVVITKDKELAIETLWPTHVWIMENIYSQEPTSFVDKKKIFLTGYNAIKTVKTDITSNVDFKSRIVFASCNLKNEHIYSEFLRDIGINDINLNCVDYSLKSKKINLKDRLLQFGKIKLVNKFEKAQHIEVDLNQVITSVPSKPHLISNKKGFLKQFIKNSPENIDYTNLLVTVLNTKYQRYPNSSVNLKCYLPLLSSYLDKSKTYWESHKISSEQREFLRFDDYGSDATYKSFVNLLYWVKDKDINWLEKTKNGNSLIAESVITSMQLPMENYLYELAEPDHTLMTAYKKISPNDKKEVLENIKNYWNKIWDSSNSLNHSSNILHTPFKKESNVFNFMNQIIESCIEDGVKPEKSLFDEKWKEIKEAFIPFSEHNPSAKSFLILSSTFELQNSLIASESQTRNKPKKI